MVIDTCFIASGLVGGLTAVVGFITGIVLVWWVEAQLDSRNHK